jgi:coenzyme F420-reducing hydrogenase alpha subunit
MSREKATRYRCFLNPPRGEFTPQWLKSSHLYQRLVEGDGTSLYCVGPLARLNVAEGMATPLAEKEYEQMFDTLGGKPVHHTLAMHWARLIEALQAAEHNQPLGRLFNG